MKLAVFDIGGTNIKCGSFQDNKITKIEKFATPKTFAGLKIQMHRFIDKHAFNGIAISAPGAVDKSSGTLKASVQYLIFMTDQYLKNYKRSFHYLLQLKMMLIVLVFVKLI